jgi:hypothetical protein
MYPNRPVVSRSHPFNNFIGKRLRERQPAGILFYYGLGGGGSGLIALQDIV